jgi:hypothetical protein
VEENRGVEPLRQRRGLVDVVVVRVRARDCDDPAPADPLRDLLDVVPAAAGAVGSCERLHDRCAGEQGDAAGGTQAGAHGTQPQPRRC